MANQNPADDQSLARYDRVTATFAPQDPQATPHYLQAAIGRRGRFRVAWKIHPGDPLAAGEWAMIPLETWDTFPFLWRPLSDLTDVELIPRRTSIERRRGGRPKKLLVAATAQ